MRHPWSPTTTVDREWTLAEVADAEASIAFSGGYIGSPATSTRALFAYDSCVGVEGGPRISIELPLIERLGIDVDGNFANGFE